VLLRLGKVLVVFALVSTLSAHWALLQSVAWTGMLAGNLQSGSIREAMAKTFDGEHPCCLCKAIASAKKSEQKGQFSVEKQKLEFPPIQGDLVLTVPSRFDLFPSAAFSAKSLLQKPLTPPPRIFFV
jgi:hypothetical protein